MTQTVPTPTDTNAGKPARLPPEEQFWKRYSPHHELSLSSATSVALHVLVFVLLALAAWLAWKLAGTHNDPLPIIGVVQVDGPAPGPGGDPAAGNGKADDQVRPEQPGKAEVDRTGNDTKPVPLPPLDPGKAADPLAVLDHLNRTPGARRVNPDKDLVDGLGQIAEVARKKMGEGLARRPGGPGGKDGGPGGPGGAGRLEQLHRRMLRWTMVFNTRDGVDYARQLSALGAIVAYPDPQDPNQYRVLRRLLPPPARGEVEDLGLIGRMYWPDVKPESVASLARGLHINPAPAHFVAFFPPELEEKLLQLERKHRGLLEERILATRFDVVPVRGGGYEPRVAAQQAR